MRRKRRVRRVRREKKEGEEGGGVWSMEIKGEAFDHYPPCSLYKCPPFFSSSCRSSSRYFIPSFPTFSFLTYPCHACFYSPILSPRVFFCSLFTSSFHFDLSTITITATTTTTTTITFPSITITFSFTLHHNYTLN